MKVCAGGFDFGNAETTLVVIMGQRRLAITVPSVTAQGTLDELNKLNITLGTNDFVFRSKDSATEQYIGDLALNQAGMSFSGRGDVSRYWSQKSLTLLLTTASSLVDDTEFGLNVVTGLPVQTYLGDPDSRRKIKQALEGTHAFTVNGRSRIIHVKVERVIMEGAGAAIAYGSRDKQVQGVIDIGGRTTDLYVAEGQTPQRHMCDGRPLGVEAAADLLRANFQQKYKRALKPQEVRNILRAYAHGTPYPDVRVHGVPVRDVDTLTGDALLHVGNEIVSFVSGKWNESEDGTEIASSFSTVLCIGGGAHYFYKQLQERIPNLRFIADPEEANAYGYAVFAEQQLARIRLVG